VPSRVQPDQDAQKPRICWRFSFVGTTAFMTPPRLLFSLSLCACEGAFGPWRNRCAQTRIAEKHGRGATTMKARTKKIASPCRTLHWPASDIGSGPGAGYPDRGRPTQVAGFRRRQLRRRGALRNPDGPRLRRNRPQGSAQQHHPGYPACAAQCARHGGICRVLSDREAGGHEQVEPPDVA